MASQTGCPWLTPEAVYIHIPFCAHHCGYCDFAVTAGQDHLIAIYLEALAEEFKATLITPRPVCTIFIGGGTPTYLNPTQLEQLFRLVNEWFPRSHFQEFSIESTPDSLDAEKVSIMQAHGLSRVSIGVQSFQPESLTALDRQHRTNHIPSAVECVKKAGLELSLDLIFGAPNSTLQQWRNDLQTAVAFKTDHISTYGLTYEKGTPLWKQRKTGTVLPVPEETELAMYELAMDTLAETGYEHYEVSNFAKPGKRCRHNEIYWANHAYYGFGTGAAKYVDGVRELNCRNTQDYIRKIFAGESAVFQSEKLNSIERAFETISTQIRRVEGIPLCEFEEQTGHSLEHLLGDTIRHLEQTGLLVVDHHSIKLSRRGFCVADGVILEMMKKQF